MTTLQKKIRQFSFATFAFCLMLVLTACNNSDYKILTNADAAENEIVNGITTVNTKLNLKASKITSNSVTIRWKSHGQAISARVLIAAEPAEFAGAALINPLQIAKLSGNLEKYKIKNLAAGVDVFIALEITTKSGTQTAMIHAKTVGGAAVKLETPLREVHLAATNILHLVLADIDGKAYQQGKWSVKRQNGSVLNVQKVYRRSMPTGTPKYSTEVDKPSDDGFVTVDHHLFLKLDKHIGNRDILEVAGPRGLKFILPFSDKYLETQVIQVNQVGYNPRAKQRYAYVYGYMGDGGVINLDAFPLNANVLIDHKDKLKAREICLKNLPLHIRKEQDDDAGGQVKEISLRDLPKAEGVAYRVQLPGIGVAYRTSVSELAVFKVFYTATRGLFHNRWGGDLNPLVTEWSRPIDHPFIYTGNQLDFGHMYPKDTPKTGKRPLSGGYHDAGDFDQRPMHTVVPMLLMSAYELHPQYYSDVQLNIPESGNGIPDFLDEILWGVAAWEQLQNEDGSVCSGVESFRHPFGYYLANKDPLPYWSYAPQPNVTARAAGLFAQSARLVKPFDPAKSAILKGRAIKAFNYAQANDAAKAYMLYASGELLQLTGERIYAASFELAWQKMGPYGAFNQLALFSQPTPNAYSYAMENRDKAFAWADYLMAYLQHPYASKSIKDLVKKWMPQFVNALINNIEKLHAHRNPRNVSTISWGKGATMGPYIETAVMILRQGNISGKQRQDLFDTLSLSADYILGCNPLGMVFYTGLGSKKVHEPLHLDSLAFIKAGKGAVPGIPVFGPVDSAPGHGWSRPAVNSFYPAMNELPLALRYADTRTFVVCNENTVWGDFAPNIKLFAALLGSNMLPPESWLPGEKDHKNPLPF